MIPVRQHLVRLNNSLVRLRKSPVAPEHLLLLLPHCLQRKACKQNVKNDLDECRRCGLCNIGELIGLRDELGIRCVLASGGREAATAVRDPAVKLVVAVACEKELCDGIRAAFPKPVVAVPNERPQGFCRDTRVDVARVRTLIEGLLAPAATSAAGKGRTALAG